MAGPSVQAWLDTEWSKDQAADEAALIKALADDAAADAAVLKAKDDEIAALKKALADCQAGTPPAGDTTPPSVPTGLAAVVNSDTQISLTWNPSSDNVAVVSYDMFRNGTQIGTRVGTSYVDMGLSAGTDYSYAVRARDAAGNLSVQSAAVVARTTGGVVVPPGPFVWQGKDTPQLQRAWMQANTGPRIPLTNSSATSASGLVVGKRFSQSITSVANGTIFRDCEVNFGGGWGIDGDNKTFTVERCRLKGTGGPAAILGNATVLGCDISGCQDGIKLQGGGLVRGTWIHDLTSSDAGAHFDGIQIQGTNNNCLIEQNRIEARDTSEVFFQELGGQINGGKIRHNWCGGSDLPIRVEAGCTNMEVIENAILKGHWGYWDLNSSVVHHGNVDAATNAPIG